MAAADFKTLSYSDLILSNDSRKAGSAIRSTPNSALPLSSAFKYVPNVSMSTPKSLVDTLPSVPLNTELIERKIRSAINTWFLLFDIHQSIYREYFQSQVSFH